MWNSNYIPSFHKKDRKRKQDIRVEDIRIIENHEPFIRNTCMSFANLVLFGNGMTDGQTK